jgi:hypothetical protein
MTVHFVPVAKICQTAINGRDGGRECPLTGVKRTSCRPPRMSAYDPKRTWTEDQRGPPAAGEYAALWVAKTNAESSPICMNRLPATYAGTQLGA